MKILKKILLSLFITASIGAVSTSVLAEAGEGRIVYKPAEAIDLTVAKIQTAIDAITTGSDGEAVSKLVKDALDSSKEINANDRVDMARSKANNKLKSARTHSKEGALQEAEQELRDAHRGFLGLKDLL
ncbi:MAG: hypothetical protein PHY16_13970 [Methylobacter sp.]|nr:hypothetical protein [Methylobacter sp.]